MMNAGLRFGYSGAAGASVDEMVSPVLCGRNLNRSKLPRREALPMDEGKIVHTGQSSDHES